MPCSHSATVPHRAAPIATVSRSAATGFTLAPPGDGLNAIPGSVHGLAPEGGRIRLRVGELAAEGAD